MSRMEQNDEGKLEPKIYDVFGPKIINGRKAFQDDADGKPMHSVHAEDHDENGPSVSSWERVQKRSR